MSTQAVDYLDVIAQLPPGSRLLLYDVDWDDYDRLLAQIGSSRGDASGRSSS
jgi:hypothetical protein